jgi:hypothetical protein
MECVGLVSDVEFNNQSLNQPRKKMSTTLQNQLFLEYLDKEVVTKVSPSCTTNNLLNTWDNAI